MSMNLLLVMLGGAVGSALRYLVGQALPAPTGTLPVATLFVNVVGSGILGFITALAFHHGGPSKEWLLLLGTGLCGGFTTFSTFSVEVISLWTSGHALMASVYVGISIIGGILAAILGAVLARAILPSA